MTYEKDYKLHLFFSDLSNNEDFVKYWEEIFINTFVGKQLDAINATPEFDGQKITIKFNLKNANENFWRLKRYNQKGIS